MANANLTIKVNESRMLSQAEAAIYTGLPAKHFIKNCSVQPVKMHSGILLWDKRDLDTWIDSLKEGSELATQDAILGKL